MPKELLPLEALERLKNTLLAEGYWQDALQDLAIIETTLKHLKATNRRNDKKVKALEIIKEKCEFDFLEEKINDMPVRYEIHIRPKEKEQLLFNCLAIYPKTEEYDLLREVIK